MSQLLSNATVLILLSRNRYANHSYAQVIQGNQRQSRPENRVDNIREGTNRIQATL